jgi:hypothetical protein
VDDCEVPVVSRKNYPMYTQFGELRSHALGFLGVLGSVKSELAEITTWVMDMPEKECSKLKSPTKGSGFALANLDSISEKLVPSVWHTGLSEC